MNEVDRLRQLGEELTTAANDLSSDLRRAGRTDIESENATFAAIGRLREGALTAIRVADRLSDESPRGQLSDR